MSLDEHDLERLAVRFAQLLDHRRSISEADHKADHEFVQELRARRQKRERMWGHVREQVLGWAIIATLGAFASGVVYMVTTWVRHTKGG